MSSRNWTDEQKSAISERGRNILVAAAAGSGKTAVLVERVMRRITDPQDLVDIDRLLVVTFTNAAAAEMRKRIGDRIAGKIEEEPERPHLKRQLALLSRASVTTIHSFCLDILRQHFHHLDLDPGFRVADDTEIALLQGDVLAEVFEESYDQEIPGFLELVEKYGGERDDGRLEGIVLELNNYARSQPHPREWLSQLGDWFRISPEKGIDSLPWCRALMEEIRMILQGQLDRLESAGKCTMMPGGPESYQTIIKEDLDEVRSLIDAAEKSWGDLYRAFQELEWGRLKPCRGEVDENLKEKVKKQRDQVKKEIGEIQKKYFCRPPESFLADLTEAAPVIDELARLVIRFDECFEKAKKNKSLVDFSDLEHYCLEILENPATNLAADLRRQFTEVLVDEYQDINSVQEAIIRMVSGERNRFMVGDVKQSIYRFRLAEPNLFMEKFRTYDNQPGRDTRKIILSRNFRSRREIIDAVNFIFKQIMTPIAGEIGYDREAELLCGREFPEDTIPERTGRPVELYLVDRQPEKEPGGTDQKEEHSSTEPEEEWDEITYVQAEARLIASRIREMVEGEPGFTVCGGSDYRKVDFRDVVVLLRATRGWANTFLEEFQMAGIPASTDLGTGYFAATEVETMLSLLKVIDNPRQDIYLAGVLRSPLFGFTVDELAAIRISFGKGDFFDALRVFRDSGQPSSEKAAEFLNKLETWRTKARRGRLADLIWDIYTETGYYHLAGSMPGGSQRQANLRALYDRARQYEAISYRGLFRFLRFVERLQNQGSDLGTARALGENENVVRIMSIHKSKGLEFPVVFVAGLGKQFNMKDLNRDILMHKDFGLGPNLVDIETRVTYPTLSRLAIQQKLKLEALAEEMRILYVAMTRSQEKLILVGSIKGVPKTVQVWAESISNKGWNLPDYLLTSARSYLDWIGPALIRHRDGRCLISIDDDPADDEIFQHSSCWQVKVMDITGEFSLEDGMEKNYRVREAFEKAACMKPVDGYGDYADLVNFRLTWHYPFGLVSEKTAKLPVTEIKSIFGPEQEQEEDYFRAGNFFRQPIPRFLTDERGLTAAKKGTAVHLVLQHLDFSLPCDEEIIRCQIETMVQNEIIDRLQAEAVDITSMMSFLSSSLGQRVQRSNQIKKETPFTLILPAEEVYPELASITKDEEVLVQGVIDLIFWEDDGWVIVDYKTGKRDEKTLAREYSGQLKFYARAVESILGSPVKEKYIYFVSSGNILLLP